MRYIRLYFYNGATETTSATADAIYIHGTPSGEDSRRTNAKDDPCVAANPQNFEGDPVNTYTGNLHYEQQDLYFPAPGLPLEWRRSYNSLDDSNRRMGYNWSHGYDYHVDYFDVNESPIGVAIVTGHGTRLEYVESGYDGQGRRAYVPYNTSGVRAQLISLDNDLTYLWTACDGKWYLFNGHTGDRLEKMGDQHGNTLTFEYSNSVWDQLLSVSHSNGQTLSMAYDGNGRVAHVDGPGNLSVQYSYDDAGRLETVTDVRGELTSYTYDALNRLTAVIDPRSHYALRNVYDAVGRVSQQTDAVDNVITYQYPDGTYHWIIAPRWYRQDMYGDDRLIQVTEYDALDNQLTTVIGSYDEWDNPASVQNANGDWSYFEYDGDTCGSRLRQITDTLGYSASFVYSTNPDHDLLQTTDPLARTTSFHYLVSARTITHSVNTGADPFIASIDLTATSLDEITNADSQTMLITSNSRGQPTAVTDAEGNTVRLGYDALGYTFLITDALGNQTVLTYDAAGRPTGVLDPAGRHTVYDYDPAGLLEAAIFNHQDGTRGPSPDEDVRTDYSYDASGNLTQITNALGQSTVIEYDERNLPTAITENGVARTEYAYDSDGNVTSITDANSHSITNSYDPLNRLVAVTDALGKQTTLEYANTGNPTVVTDASGRSIRYQYDALGRMTRIEDDLDNAIQMSYDPVGNLTSVIDALGVTTAYGYDALNRLERVVEDVGGKSITTEYDYDRVGNLLQVEDARDKLWNYTYTDRNQLATASDPESDTNTYFYDALGRLDHLVDANDTTLSWGYDGFDRVTQVQHPAETVGYGYDALGNRLTMSDGSGYSTSYAYDGLNRLTQVTRDSRTVAYGYDQVGNRTQLVYPSGRTVNYGYDATDRLVGASADDFAASYQYDDAGRLMGGSVGDEGTPVSYSREYDAAGRLDQITVSAEESYTFTYTLDDVGNRVQEMTLGGEPQTRLENPVCFVYLPIVIKGDTGLSPEPFTYTVNYQYDTLSRLLSAVATESITYTYVYTYDDAGNRIAGLDPTGSHNYSYDDASRLTQANGQSYTWDDNGNLTGDGLWTYEYDAANRLRRVISDTSTIVEYTYNGDGALVERTAGGETVEYTVDPVGLADILEARNGGRRNYLSLRAGHRWGRDIRR